MGTFLGIKQNHYYIRTHLLISRVRKYIVQYICIADVTGLHYDLPIYKYMTLYISVYTQYLNTHIASTQNDTNFFEGDGANFAEGSIPSCSSLPIFYILAIVWVLCSHFIFI